jgi:hypothetical protein
MKEVQELKELLMQKAGLTEEQANKSLAVMKDYIKSKIPPMMQGMVDKYLGKQKEEEDYLDR